jgi:hypothetical protein
MALREAIMNKAKSYRPLLPMAGSLKEFPVMDCGLGMKEVRTGVIARIAMTAAKES